MTTILITPRYLNFNFLFIRKQLEDKGVLAASEREPASATCEPNFNVVWTKRVFVCLLYDQTIKTKAAESGSSLGTGCRSGSYKDETRIQKPIPGIIYF